MSATQQGGGGRRKNDGQPHEPCGEDAKCSPLQGTIEAHEGAVQGAGGAGLESVPLSRRTRWSAKGQAQWRLPTWRLHTGGRRSLSVCQGDGETVEADTGRDCIDANSTLRPSVSFASQAGPSRQGPWQTGGRQQGGGWRRARSAKGPLARQKWKLQAQKNAQRLLTASMP